MKKYAIMMAGKTHSGKKTFARNIKDNIKNSVILETDPITLFLKNE